MPTCCGRSRSTTDWGRSGSSLTTVSGLLRLMTWSWKIAGTRRRQSWAQPMNTPQASDSPLATSRAARAVRSPCSGDWASPSNPKPDKQDVFLGRYLGARRVERPLFERGEYTERIQVVAPGGDLAVPDGHDGDVPVAVRVTGR